MIQETSLMIDTPTHITQSTVIMLDLGKVLYVQLGWHQQVNAHQHILPN